MKRLTERFGIPQDIVDIWCQEEGPSLLEVQARAIEEFRLLDGHSLFVTAPSSAGKTFVGEVAAICGYYRGTKSVYLVPMKAIAEEKFAEFERKYKEFGINVVISTSDRTEYDNSILAGYYDIAIVIFEKMNVLLTQNPSILNGCGLIVVDEVQLLNDKSRGPGLEILLTKIKMVKERSEQPIQFLCLSAVLGNINRFHEWLGATHCDVARRPLELYEGVLSPNGALHLHAVNAGVDSVENLTELSAIRVPAVGNHFELEPSVQERLVSLCKRFVSEGKKVLVFRKWRSLARDTARLLAASLGLPAATNVIQELRDTESTNSKEALIECLGGGIAFHSSDLSLEARLAVERHFRDASGQVQVVCCTSTLAMGVNLPASVVLLPDTLKPDSDSEEFHEIPISASDYKNMAGRAGRTRFQEEGLSIMLANSLAESTKYWRNYVQGELDTLQPALKRTDLRKIILGIVASGICHSEEEVASILLSSYSGHLFWNATDQSRQAFVKGVKDSIDYLLQQRLLQEDGDLTATRFGKLCATSGVDVDTFVILQGILESVDVKNWDPWEVIFPCLHARELADQIRINLKIQPSFSPALWAALEADDPRNMKKLLDWSRTINRRPDGILRRICAYLILIDWITGVELRQIEDKYSGVNRFLSGVVRNLGETLSWMVQTLARIALAMEYPMEFVDCITILAERLSRGLPEEGIALDQLQVRGVTRPVIKKLVESGYGSLSAILDTPAADFKGIASPPLVGRIQEAVVATLDASQERSKHEQVLRLEKLGFEARVLRAVYEAEGVPLEIALVDLLNAPPLFLGAEHIATQREGEPDIRLALNEGLLVGSVTASAKPVSDSKCAEILRSGARLNPTSYVVFGRPCFHDLAVRNSKHISGQLGSGKSYKLIPIQDLGDLFVRVVEGRISRQKLIGILMSDVGLVRSKMIMDDIGL